MDERSNNNEQAVWYAIRVTYNREMKVKAELDELKIRSFVPMQYKAQVRDGRLVKRLVPSVHNLIFIYISPSGMRHYKETTSLPIRYIMRREPNGRRTPVIVPQDQMESFIAVAGTYDEQLVYLSPNPGDFSQGDRVRILGGPFEGTEGIFVRVKGDRRVVVSIEGVVAVATTYIHPSLLEKIER
ncbi:MAG: UpxY family transcription antiterminator [Muribaculaceae bacterium]|nr:UpxY family transcription antiterminator [Muribaculaceae bacterium]